MSANPQECPLCHTDFDDRERRPRTLPCGHTACTLCITGLQQQQGGGPVTCAECRVSHAVPEVGQFPICYALEAVIRMVRDAKVAAAAATSVPPSARGGEGGGKKDGAGRSKKKMHPSLQTQETQAVAAITACQDAQAQLEQYKATLTGWCEQQQQQEDKLMEMMDQSRTARELLEQETSRVAAKARELQEGRQEVVAVLGTLPTMTTEEEAAVAATEVARCIDEAEQVLKECQESFPDAITFTTAMRVTKVSDAVLKALQTVQADKETLPTPGQHSPLSDLATTIMGRLQLILAQDLKAEDLRSLTPRTKSLLEAGRVFAVHQVKGEPQHARITLEAGKLYLHALQKQKLPLGMATLQLSEVVSPCPPCKVFLDLGWPGRPPRRVIIHLKVDTPHGRQLLLLCTGQCYPSYINTRMFRLVDKWRWGESVVGRCHLGDGVNRASLLMPGLDKTNYRTLSWEGAVYGFVWKDQSQEVCDLFGICTLGLVARELVFGGVERELVFGEVVEGLHVVQEAARHTNITEVTVVDCGVVL